MPRKRLFISFLGVFVVASVITPSYGWEWQGRCGLSRSSLQTCTITKGDAVLKGEIGMLYTYRLPSGKEFERFMPSEGRGRACAEEGYMRQTSKTWFPIRSICEGDLIMHQLPTGNNMLIEIYDSP